MIKLALPSSLLLAAAIATIPFATAQAATETNFQSGTSTTFDTDISTTDLLTGITPTGVYTVSAGTNPANGNPITAGDAVTKSDNGFTLTGFNDGSADDAVPSNKTVLFSAGQLGTSALGAPQMTFTLDTSVNTLGYNLTDIVTINGYSGYSQQLANQSYSVSFSTVLNPNFFIPLASVEYAPFSNVNSGASTKVVLSDLTQAVGVKSVQFTYTAVPNQESVAQAQLIREIDVNGVATVATPEPSTYAMLAMGLGALAFLVRRRTLA